MKITRLAPAIAGAWIACAGAHGAVTVYNDDLAGFLAAAGPTQIEDFNSATPGTTINTGPPIAVGAVTVEHVGSDGNSFFSAGADPNNIDGTTHLDIFVGPEFVPIFPAESFVITLPFAVTAAGFEIADFFSGGTSFGSDVFAGDEFAFNTTAEGLAGTNGAIPATFIGFVSDTPFSTITFSSNDGFGEAFGIDNLRFVPSPGPAALCLLAGALGARRRR